MAIFIEGFVPNKVVSIFSFGEGSRAPRSAVHPPSRSRGAAPLRSRSPWRPAQMTYRSRGGVGGCSRGGTAPPAAPTPQHPCHRHSTVGPCKMTDVNFGYTSLEGNDIFIKMKMRFLIFFPFKTYVV